MVNYGKNEIIGHIHTLVSNNVIGDKQAMSRYKGFRGELFLDSYMKEKYPSRQYFEGGMIISQDSVQTSFGQRIVFMRNRKRVNIIPITLKFSPVSPALVLKK